jgi:hypothetical protein
MGRFVDVLPEVKYMTIEEVMQYLIQVNNLSKKGN